MQDVPTIALTDAEAMMAREAIRRTFIVCCNLPTLQLRAEQLILCIDQRRERASARYYQPHRRAWRRLRRGWRGLWAWYWRRCPEWAVGTALLLIAATLVVWAVWLWE